MPVPIGRFIQELENAPTSKAMFLIEYVMEGRSPVLVITYQQDFRRFLYCRRGSKINMTGRATAKPNTKQPGVRCMRTPTRRGSGLGHTYQKSVYSVSRNGSISKETRLHIQNGWERDNGVCSFQRTKSPQRNNQNATACVVRYVACGNLKHTLKVEKRSNPQPRGRADPERQVLGAEASGGLSR